MNRKLIKSALFVVAALVLAGQAHGSQITVNSSNWSGSCDTSNGLDGNGGWGNNGCKISWNITRNSKTCDYNTPTIGRFPTNTAASVYPGDINHFIIGCGSSFGSKDICSGTSGSSYCGNWNGYNNPGLPCNIYGIDFKSGGSKCTYQLVTDCAPVWGDCYSTDGNKNDVCNQGFCSDGGYGCNGNQGNYNDWVPCPGNPCVVVPVPSSLWTSLLTLAALAVTGFARRQRARV